MSDVTNSESRECTCEAWKKYSPILFGAQIAASFRYGLTEYPAKGIFIYCPWCSAKLKEVQ